MARARRRSGRFAQLLGSTGDYLTSVPPRTYYLARAVAHLNAAARMLAAGVAITSLSGGQAVPKRPRATTWRGYAVVDVVVGHHYTHYTRDPVPSITHARACAAAHSQPRLVECGGQGAAEQAAKLLESAKEFGEQPALANMM